MIRRYLRTSALSLSIVGAVALVALLAMTPARTTAQEGPYTTSAAPATPTPTPTVVPIAGPPTTVVPVEIVAQVENSVSVDSSGTETVSASTSAADGSEAIVSVPPGALPEGATVEIAAIANIEELIQQAPPATFADIDLVVSFTFTATATDGSVIEQFDEPIEIALTVEADAVAPEADLQDLVVAFWNGFRWVILDTTVTVNADGSLNLSTQTDHFTVFVILQLRPTIFEVSAAGPLSQGIAGTNDPRRLAAVQQSRVESLFMLLNGEWLVYVPGAPTLVNSLTSSNLTPDSPVIVRFLGLPTKAAHSAQ